MDPGQDPALAVYRVRAIRLGALTCAIVLASSVVYAAVPGHVSMAIPQLVATELVGSAATVGIVLVPWPRLFGGWGALATLYVWTAACIGLVDTAVAGTGGGRSPLWVDNLLVVLFFAAVYPRRSHVPLLVLTVGGYVLALAGSVWALTPATEMVRFATLVATYVLTAFLARELAGMARGHAQASERARHRADLLAGVARVATRGLAAGADGVLAAAVRAPRAWGQDWAAIWRLGSEGVAGRLGPSDGLDAATRGWLDRAAPGLARAHPDGTRPVVVGEGRGPGGAGSVVAAPIRVGGRLGALLVCGSAAAARPVAEDLEAVGILAAEVGEALGAVDLREALAASEARFRSLIQHAADPVAVFTPEGELLYTSPRYLDMFGIGIGPVDAAAMERHVHPHDRRQLEALVGQALAQPARPATAEIRLGDVREPMTASARWRTLELTITDLRHEAAVGGLVANFHDITERKAAEQVMAQAALHDPLTGLANRTLLQDRLDHAVRRLDRHPGLVGMILVDLDRFKTINDTFGHGVGDALLRAVATRLLRVTRPEDTVARLGGDEFAIACEDLPDPGAILQVASKVAEAVREPIELEGREILITPSVGVAVGGAGARQDDLVRDADIALYRAKECGRDRIEVFDERLRSRVVELASIEQALRRARELGQLHLVYQPVVDLATGAVPMVEALLRWTHPELGIVDPAQFIPLAEDTGLIQSIGEWTLMEACAAIQRLRCGGPAEAATLRVAVNVSARQFLQGDLGGAVRRALAQSGLEPPSLTLEVTESTVMADYATAANRLRALRRLGVDIALDDFGTGYSSLAHLQDLPISQLKVDRSFVGRLESSPNGRVIVAAVVGLAAALGHTAIAEGVESLGQLEALRRAGCTLGQGFLWAAGLSPDELVAWLRLTGTEGRLRPSGHLPAGMMAADDPLLTAPRRTRHPRPPSLATA
ncbi:MAG TPA: EAL domain-containing protein [Candidatus Micrarchaeia archaeon]|nr:EAL domain-containing protein [Candidatus Micrarchaeia archaeon]